VIYAAPFDEMPQQQYQYLPPQEMLPPDAVGPYDGGPYPGQTYPYDGGPQYPVPQPGAVQPGATPQPSVPLTGKVVSLPRQTTGGVLHYTSFSAATPAPATAPVAPVSTTPYRYPAYGEQALPSVRR
jgi:hypothetical protein